MSIAAKNFERIKTTCPRDCYDACGIVVETRNGRISKVLGDPDHAVAQGALCTKCALAYNSAWIDPSQRLLTPLRRTGAKGTGLFERVSWETALGEITARLQPLVDTSGAKTVLHTHYTGTCSLLAGNYPQRFFHRLGATEVDPDSVCNKAGHVALGAMFGSSLDGFDARTSRDASCLVVWGANPSTCAPHIHKHWLREFPGALIVVDPIRHGTAEIATLHLQVRPGTDAALAFGLLHLLRNQGALDRDFIAAHVRGWVDVEDQLDACTPHWTEEITGVPAAQLEQAARLYGKGPSLLWMGQGLQRQRLGGNVMRSVALLPVATGQIGKPGTGWMFMNGFASRGLDLDYLTAEHLRREPAPSLSHMDLAAALEDPARSQVLFCWNNNIVASSPAQNRLRVALQRENLLTICCDLFHTDTVDYADYVLPAASFLEFDDLIASYFHYTLSAQVRTTEPFGESLPNQEIFRRLAKKLKFSEREFQDSDAEIIARLLANCRVPMTFAELAARGTVDVAPDPVIPFAGGMFPTESGRIEIDASAFLEAGLPAAPQPFVQAPTQNGRLRILSPATPWLMNSSYGNAAPIRRKLGAADALLHPNELAARGLVDGKPILLSNDSGQLQVIARSSDAVPPGVCVVYKSRWTRLAADHANVNVLNPGEKSDIAESCAVHSIEADCIPLPAPTSTRV